MKARSHWKIPLVYTINDLYRDRNEGREVLHGYQSGASKHLHMLPQIVFICKQLLALLPRYAWKTWQKSLAETSF